MPLRILYVITKANWGGAQRYVFDLATAAQKAGHHVQVMYGETGLLVKKLTAEGIPTTQLPGLMRDVGFFRELRALLGLCAFFRTARPDIVHINSSKAGALGAFAARTLGVPRIIFTAHGWAFNEARPPWQRALLFIASGIIVMLSHETICVSEAIRRDIRSFPGAPKKLKVIMSGIQCFSPMPRAAARAALAPPSIGKYWIGMISELHPTKRIEDALRAMHRIAANHPDTLLVVMGEGEERQELEALVRLLGLHERVYLAGFRSEARSLLGAFDLFLHTSQSEALGYAVLEAGCAELPVIATNVGGIPEIILDADHGVLVPPRSPEAIANAIESVMRDSKYAHELGARLHARVLHTFSLEKMIAETLLQYRT